MGLLHDLFFGPRRDSRPGEWSDEEQDERVEEQGHRTDAWSVDEDATEMADNQTTDDPYRDAARNKIRPELEIVRLKPTVSGDSTHLEVWMLVKNNSEFDVELKKVTFLGRSTEPLRHVRAGDSHELRAYSGDTPTSDANDLAQLQYKIVENGDYFQADHDVTFRHVMHDNVRRYVPDGCDLRLPIRDV